MTDPIHHRILRLEKDLEELRETDAKLSHTLSGIEQSTSDIIDFFNAFKGAFKALEMSARVTKPVIYLVMFASLMVGAVATLKELGLL